MRYMRYVLTLFMALTLALSAGCNKGSVDLSAVEPPLRAMIERHDKYVNADAAMNPTEKGIALRTSALVSRTLDTALQKNTQKKVECPGGVCPTDKPTARARGVPDEEAILLLEMLVYKLEREDFKRRTGNELTFDSFLASMKPVDAPEPVNGRHEPVNVTAWEGGKTIYDRQNRAEIVDLTKKKTP